MLHRVQYRKDSVKVRLWCIRHKLDGWKVTDICKTINISRTIFYRYWHRYQKDGFDGLAGRSTRTHTIHRIYRKVEQKMAQVLSC
ncbi:MAG: hypothetical protein DA328_09025 [Nitrososphaeraceae archaeon]|nr:hypothetical protein [Nitrososphaeraceae archaeon]